MISEIALLWIGFFALLQDILWHRIKNIYVLLTLIAGILCQILAGNVLYGILGAAFGMLLYPLFLLRFMGAGDVKMFCVLGAWAGFPDIVELTVCCILVNGAVAFVIMLNRKNGIKLFKRFGIWLKTCVILREYIPMEEEADQSDKYPYMIGVFLGIIVFCLIGGGL